MEDITGRRFGSYTAIKKTDKNTVWLCRCVCGTENKIPRTALKRGRRTRCRKCSSNDRREDLTGQVFGKWTVIKFVGNYKKQRYCWECKCECGNIRHIPSGRLKFKSSTQCRSCQSREYVGKISGNYFCKIKRSAQFRKIDFFITKEYIWELFLKQEKKCAISGIDIDFATNTQEEKILKTTASLDRIDSSKGYIEGNVQWVHKDVNWMKQDYDQDYFINICKIIAENNK